MKSAGGQRIFYRPIHRPAEHIRVVLVQSKNKASIDHDTQRMESLNSLLVILSNILPLVALYEISIAQCFKTHKDATHARGSRPLDQVAPEYRGDGARPLEYPVHSLHPFKQPGGKSLMTQ